MPETSLYGHTGDLVAMEKSRPAEAGVLVLFLEHTGRREFRHGRHMNTENRRRFARRHEFRR
jgi:uncharacterized membrane protein